MPTVTFALSSETIVENSENRVTLTATANIQSGVEITIPFTLSGTASLEEYEVSANTIVIPPNATSGSISISTYGKNDNDIEVVESIIFNIGSITNAITETPTVTLSLLSEDLSTINEVEIDEAELVEGESTSLTLSLNSPNSFDIYVPIVFSGTATKDQDYTSTFPAQGEQRLIGQLNSNNYSKYGVLADGRHVFLYDNQIKIMSADTRFENSATLGNSYATMQIEGNNIYVINDDRIGKININNIASNSVTVEQIVALNNSRYDGFEFSVENGKILYSVILDNTDTRQLWLLEAINTPPVLLASGLQCCYRSILVDGNVYQLEWWGYRKLFANGTQGPFINYNGGVSIHRDQKIVVKNGILYGLPNNNNVLGIVQIDLAMGNGFVSYLPINIGSEITTIRSFDFTSTGNIILLNQRVQNNQTVSQLNSYLLATTIKVPAGQTSASITINSIDDDSDETNENISLNLGTSSNVNIGSFQGSQIIILDNDSPPTVTFELSNQNIVENSVNPVTLTATLSEVSGYDVTIPFTMSGTAGVNEYSVSSSSILIPAGSSSGSTTVSTSNNNDNDVEVLETIIFNIGSITNATTTTTQVILNLESEDNPNLVSVVAEPLVFAEHEFSAVTATIDAAASRDVYVPLNVSGTATFDIDYSVEFDSKGEESLLKVLSQESLDFDVLSDNRLIVLTSYNQLQIHELDGTITSIQLQDNATSFIVKGNQVIMRDWPVMHKLDLTTMVQSTIGVRFTNASNAQYLDSFDFVNNKLFTLVNNNSDGNKIINSQIQGQALTQIGVFNTWPLRDAQHIAVNSNEEIYVATYNSIYKIVNGQGVLIVDNIGSQIRELRFINNMLYVKVNDNLASGLQYKILRLNALSPGVNNTYTLLPYQVGEDVDYIKSFTFNGNGQLLISVTTTSGAYKINTYNFAPVIKIPAGATVGSIQFNGIEDDLNAPGEETNETVILSVASAQNATISNANPIENLSLTILNNELSLVLNQAAFANVSSLMSSSAAWGDFDRDGDQDLAIMGISLFEGVITRLYKNNAGVFENFNNGIFAPTFEGDLIWVDYDKDGYIDLIISGLDPNNEPSTKIYKNINGQTFNLSTDLILPNLFGTSIDYGDLDNDGDIDFVINGSDINNVWKKYIYKTVGSQLVLEQDFQNQFNQNGYENGVVKIADFEKDGDLDIFMLGETNASIKKNTYIKTNQQNFWSSLENVQNGALTIFGDYVYYMGKNPNQSSMVFKRMSLQDGNNQEVGIIGLMNGDIAIGDYNNDGFEDIVVTGENLNAESVTKLYNGTANGFVENTEIALTGLRNSTANWVDYDLDGDLDLFLNGTNDSGEFSLLYKTNLLNKNNSAAPQITNLVFENLGNGKVRLSWDEPEDDFSQNLGYILRIGTTESGTELSNTQSNLETGQRLITKSTQINTNSYELLLDPGNYFWSVQSVDTGLVGSLFSEEESFQLTYDWKLLNQGGIIDRSIEPINSPIVKLTDIDGDNDMDLVYGSKTSSQPIQVYKLADERFQFFDNVNNSGNITDIDFIDINNDLILDILVNTWNTSSSDSFLRLFVSNSQGGFNQVFSAPGLFKAKVELIDINNDGQKEIVQAGRTSAAANSVFKVYVFEQDGNNSLSPTRIDVSNQFIGLREGSFGFGDIDQDEDIDFGIIGLSNFGVQSKIYFNQTIFTETVAPIFQLASTITNLTPAIESTFDFIDFDSDGDLDVMITGQGATSNMFKLYSNNGLSGAELSFTEVQNTQLDPVRSANMDFGDFNGDGYLDIIYNGLVTGSGQVTKLLEFEPITQSYVESNFDISDIINASIAFGDIDGDFDLDFSIAGQIAGQSGSNPTPVIKTYLNVRNDSAEVINSSGRTLNRSTNDVTFITNDPPSVPNGLTNELISFNPQTGYRKIKFSWNPSSDDHTNTEGLTYALKVGTTNGGSEIMQANALPNGFRLNAGRGNVEQNLEWQLNLPAGQYYWSVQAIDASYSGSSFSETSSFNTSTLSSFDTGENTLNVEVYPNPAKHDLVYIVGGNHEPMDAKLYNLEGRLILSEEIKNNSINISKLSSGVYMLKIISNSKSKVVKLIVQ